MNRVLVIVTLVILLAGAAWGQVQAKAKKVGEVYEGVPYVGTVAERTALSDADLLRFAETFRAEYHPAESNVLYAEYLKRVPLTEQVEFGQIWNNYIAAEQEVPSDTEEMLLNAARWEELASRAKDATVALEAAYEAGSAYCNLRAYGDSAQKCLDALAVVPDDHHGHLRVLYMRSLAYAQQGKWAESNTLAADFETRSTTEEVWVEQSRTSRAIWNADRLITAHRELEAVAECEDALQRFPKARWAAEIKYREGYAYSVLGKRQPLTTEQKTEMKARVQEYLDTYPEHQWVELATAIKESTMAAEVVEPIEGGMGEIGRGR